MMLWEWAIFLIFLIGYYNNSSNDDCYEYYSDYNTNINNDNVNNNIDNNNNIDDNHIDDNNIDNNNISFLG